MYLRLYCGNYLRISSSIMKEILISVLLLLNMLVYGQSIRKQIGTSVWKKEGIVLAGPFVSYVIDYNKQGNKTREWQVSRDTTGNVVDTNYAELDNAGRLIHFYGGKEHWYSVYDSMDTETKLTAYRTKDSFTIIYNPSYRNGKLISKVPTYNGQPGQYSITYKYKGRTVVESQGGIIVRTVKRNKLEQEIFIKAETNHNNQRTVTITKYRRDAKGNVLYYTKKENGGLTKSTKHFFINGVEQSQIEHFYNPEYIVTTTFTYDFWE